MTAPPPAPSQATPLPAVSLFGRSFLSRSNLRVGWAILWRVGLADSLISSGLRGAMRWIRDQADLDPIDRVALLMAGTVAGLLVCDWAGRSAARRYYQLDIARFIGLAIAWRQGLAVLVLGGIFGLTTALIVGAVQISTGGGAGEALIASLIAVCGVLGVVLGVAITGWAAHRAFAAGAPPATPHPISPAASSPAAIFAHPTPPLEPDP